jgi:hypothetical protein
MEVLEVKGIDKVVRGFARYKRNVGKGVENGLLAGGLKLMHESLKIVPVQIGNLKASWFVSQKGKGLRAVITIGYATGEDTAAAAGTPIVSPKAYAPYAVYVHEIANPPVAHGEDFNVKHAAEIEAAAGTWRGTAEGGMFYRKAEEQYKYLERPVREFQKDVLNIIRSEIKKKARK